MVVSLPCPITLLTTSLLSELVTNRPVLKIEVQERCDRIAVLRRIRKRTEGVAEVQNELFSSLGCERSFMASLAKVNFYQRNKLMLAPPLTKTKS